VARLRSSRAQAAGAGHRDNRWRSERFPAPAVPGRRTTAGTSPRDDVSCPALCVSASLRLCVECLRGGLCAFATSRLCVKNRICDAFVSLCLRVCDVALCLLCESLCLCGSSGGWAENPESGIRNPKSEIRNSYILILPTTPPGTASTISVGVTTLSRSSSVGVIAVTRT